MRALVWLIIIVWHDNGLSLLSKTDRFEVLELEYEVLELESEEGQLYDENHNSISNIMRPDLVVGTIMMIMQK